MRGRQGSVSRGGRRRGGSDGQSERMAWLRIKHTKERLYSDCTGVEMRTRRLEGSRRSLIQGESALVQGAIRYPKRPVQEHQSSEDTPSGSAELAALSGYVHNRAEDHESVDSNSLSYLFLTTNSYTYP